jgi:hypothetical protein
MIGQEFAYDVSYLDQATEHADNPVIDHRSRVSILLPTGSGHLTRKAI